MKSSKKWLPILDFLCGVQGKTPHSNQEHIQRLNSPLPFILPPCNDPIKSFSKVAMRKKRTNCAIQRLQEDFYLYVQVEGIFEPLS